MHSLLIAEYERAVIFRLGRLRKGGSKGPGIFTVIPCIDTYRCVDLRTVSFDVPPQEVSVWTIIILSSIGVRFVFNSLASRFSRATPSPSASMQSCISTLLTRNKPCAVLMTSGDSKTLCTKILHVLLIIISYGLLMQLARYTTYI